MLLPSAYIDTSWRDKSMRTGRPKSEVKMSNEDREQLESWANARSMPQGIAARMQIVLLAAQGLHPLDCQGLCRRNRGIEIHRPTGLELFWGQTAPESEFQALHRPVLRGKSPRHRWPLS